MKERRILCWFQIEIIGKNVPKFAKIFDNSLKVPKCEILDRSDFHYFYTIKPFWVDDFVV